MLISTWNVNSIKQRMDNVRAWLRERSPDVACLQETKCTDEAFPREALEELGYNVAIHGQKTFNGVAVLSKRPFDEVTTGLPGDQTDDHARFIEAVIPAERGVMRVACLYLPNGNPAATDKYTYKIKWMDRLSHYVHERMALEEPLVLAGDFNVIPSALDARHPQAWVNDALYLPQTREKFRALCHLGLIDVLRSGSEGPGRRLAEGQWHPDRPPAGVVASRGSAHRRRRRQARPRLGKAVGPCTSLGGDRRVGASDRTAGAPVGRPAAATVSAYR
jgi:exodeoxyribonuclease-3